MIYSDLVKKLQTQMNNLGQSLAVDGDPGPKTKAALELFDVATVLSLRPVQVQPIGEGKTHLHPIDWARGEIGQKEIYGVKDNPRIRWYYTHCANIGSKEYPDEVAWCSAFVNAAADECGMFKTDNALAVSWKNYGVDSGDDVEEGDIIVLGTHHVTMANRAFNRKKVAWFEGLGGNQADQCKVSIFKTSEISAVRKWKSKPETVTMPIGSKAVSPISVAVGDSTK